MSVMQFRCEYCGGEVEVVSRFSAMVTCRYCNTVYFLDNEHVESQGKSEPFEPLSLLRVGAVGRLEGKDFSVLGRIRLDDEDDVWDEWLVLLNGVPYWLEESANRLTKFQEVTISTPLPKYEDIGVGSQILIEGVSVYVVERGSAEVAGVEGEFSGKLKPDKEYRYIQGSVDDEVYAIEYYDDAIRLLKGHRVDYGDVEMYEN